jgi:hypothetical protein
VNSIAKTSAHDLEDALDHVEREYLYGEISREERNDRRHLHIAWFEARGIEGPDDEPVDAADATQRPQPPSRVATPDPARATVS